MPTLDRNAEVPGRKKRVSIFRVGGTSPEKDETEVRWLMSYSDFMMQLVCLFIMLYSVSSVDTAKAAALSQAWREEVGLGEVRVPSAPGAPHAPLTTSELSPILHELRILAGRHPGGSALRVVRAEDGFRLQFGYEMFDRGSDRPGKQGASVLELAGILLQPLQERVASIEVAGHASADEADDAALSLNRAREAVRSLTRPEAAHRLDPAVLIASGRGAHEPAADNASTGGRALNRRIEFVVRFAAHP